MLLATIVTFFRGSNPLIVLVTKRSLLSILFSSFDHQHLALHHLPIKKVFQTSFCSPVFSLNNLFWLSLNCVTVTHPKKERETSCVCSKFETHEQTSPSFFSPVSAYPSNPLSLSLFILTSHHHYYSPFSLLFLFILSISLFLPSFSPSSAFICILFFLSLLYCKTERVSERRGGNSSNYKAIQF